MLDSFKNHPFKIKAFFKSSIVITYAVKKEELENKIPFCLQLDTFNNEWAFVAAAFVRTKKLRPAGLPEFLGLNFFLIGYRIFTTYKTSNNKRLRGLYILKSETDKSLMKSAGNFFTHYNYTKTDVNFKLIENEFSIQSGKSGIDVKILKKENAELPKHSPFTSWKEARRFEGPLPFTFYPDKEKNEILIIEGVRQNWIPQPLEIVNCNIEFIEQMKLNTAILANAFLIENVNYHWEKGFIDTCNQ